MRYDDAIKAAVISIKRRYEVREIEIPEGGRSGVCMIKIPVI
jgi:hypothetical protein